MFSRITSQMGLALPFLIIANVALGFFVGPPQTPIPSPQSLLASLHAQAAMLAPSDRVDLLAELSIAATGANPKLSAEWSIEMYDCASSTMPNGQNWEQMTRAAQRKNALTILSFSDPDAAAERFTQLEPSPAHRPLEDPRVDLSRHLFPRLWARDGLRSLPAIRRLASFTAESGEYPYAAMATLLPQIAPVDRSTARALFTEAVRRMPGKIRVHRTQDVYIRFLRAGWPIASRRERLEAIHAGVSAAEQSLHDFEIAPGAHSYFEYYLPQDTVRLDSEADARIYELLPFVDDVDRALGGKLRERYPHLQGLALPLRETAPWRAAAFAGPGRNTPELVERAFERHNIRFAETWAQQDARRAATIALSAKDVDLKWITLARVLPWYAKVDSAQAETWRLEMERNAQQSNANLDFLVALIRDDFLMGYPAEARKLAWLAWKQALPHLTAATGDQDLSSVQELEDVCGQFWFGDAAWYAETEAIENPATRLMLLARYARGALRNNAGYQEPS
jgi:hypothetical protein